MEVLLRSSEKEKISFGVEEEDEVLVRRKRFLDCRQTRSSNSTDCRLSFASSILRFRIGSHSYSIYRPPRDKYRFILHCLQATMTHSSHSSRSNEHGICELSNGTLFQVLMLRKGGIGDRRYHFALRLG